jgi:hypothetical protein
MKRPQENSRWTGIRKDVPVSSRTLIPSHARRFPSFRVISEARAFIGALEDYHIPLVSLLEIRSHINNLEIRTMN